MFETGNFRLINERRRNEGDVRVNVALLGKVEDYLLQYLLKKQKGNPYRGNQSKYKHNRFKRTTDKH